MLFTTTLKNQKSIFNLAAENVVSTISGTNQDLLDGIAHIVNTACHMSVFNQQLSFTTFDWSHPLLLCPITDALLHARIST